MRQELGSLDSYSSVPLTVIYRIDIFYCIFNKDIMCYLTSVADILRMKRWVDMPVHDTRA